MRLQRRNVLLLVVLGGLVALNVALERPVRTVASSGPLLAGFAPHRVARIAVEAPDGARLEIVRAGDRWTLPARHGFPALTFAVEELCARVRDLSRADLVSEEAESHARYGVGSGGLVINPIARLSIYSVSFKINTTFSLFFMASKMMGFTSVM